MIMMISGYFSWIRGKLRHAFTDADTHLLDMDRQTDRQTDRRTIWRKEPFQFRSKMTRGVFFKLISSDLNRDLSEKRLFSGRLEFF